MRKSLVCVAAVAMIAGVVADDVYLHVKVQSLTEEIAGLSAEVERARKSPIQKALAELKVEFAEFATELKSFEKFTAEKDEALVKAVNKLEDWVETSSVQGKWNGYKRQLGDCEARIAAKYRQTKDSLQKKIDAMKLKYQKVKDSLAE